jgi:hypothetical protein
MSTIAYTTFLIIHKPVCLIILCDIVGAKNHLTNRNQLYLYFYDPLSSFSTHASYPPQQPSHHHITTK